MPAEPSTTTPSPELVAQAKTIVLTHQRASIALIQRHLRIGYTLGSNIMRELEAQGVVKYFSQIENPELMPSYRREPQ
jgi:DNA segregation ATPase FtsK/SpoIIIE-like protein